MDDHGYDQAACRRAAELLREEADWWMDADPMWGQPKATAYRTAAEWLEERA